MQTLTSLDFDTLITLSSVVLFGAVVLSAIWLGPAWDIVSSRAVAKLTPQLENLRIGSDKLNWMLRAWGAAMLATFIMLFFYWDQKPLSLMITWLVYIAPHHILTVMVQRRRKKLRDQMVGATVSLANSVRAGLALAQGMESICDDTPEPLATEFRTVVFEWRAGRSLNSAIQEVKQRLDLDSFTLFSVAISACLERGGRITEALERISHSLGVNQKLERELDAKTATGRSTAWVLGCFPFIFLLAFLAFPCQHVLALQLHLPLMRQIQL